jgi:protein gp37
MQVEWVRELRDRCRREGVAFFFKQWGGRTSKVGGRLLDGQLWSEMPTPKDRSDQAAESLAFQVS